MIKARHCLWLHGLILAGAIAGCKSSSCNCCGGAGHDGPPPPVATGAAYSPTVTQGISTYPSTTGVPTTQGMGSGQTFVPQATTPSPAYPTVGDRFNGNGTR